MTGELDRWKRHCHVLGGELKNQRTRITEVEEASHNSVATIPDIDELTDIRGIGKALVRKLHLLGIYRYEDLLNLDDDHEHCISGSLDTHHRVSGGSWRDAPDFFSGT